MNERNTLVLALFVRVAFLVYGEWQDRVMDVKYTDIDYKVYSDASFYVSEGKSPYLRHTYRYTPLLSYLLLPNIWISWFGKLIFITSDLLTGQLIFNHLKQNHQSASYNLLWLLNPLVFNISTRGSSDSLSSLLILLTIYFIQKRDEYSAGLCFGLSVHFRIYPIIYSLIFYFWVEPSKNFLHPRRLKFALTSATVFLFLIFLFYQIYGFEFLFETYLFHFTRKDNRHNFSLYFYPLYLTYSDNAKFVGLLAFIPQWALVLLISFSRVPPTVSMLCVTFVFVIFNKVCTAQYFIWYITLLPIACPFIKINWKQALTLVIPWVLTEVHWLFWAYNLEILGESCFLQLWGASLLFFLANLRILTVILRNSQEKDLKIS
jgi:phosphatidylinositol glycan class M